MRALFFMTGDDEPVKVIEIENTLKAMQEVVDGPIEVIGLTPRLALVCNEEGLIRNLRPQRVLSQWFFGNVLLVGTKGEEFTDIPEGTLELFTGGES